MTSDPKAPEAAAVYLYREETTNDKLSLRTLYERIKILTEKGKDLAIVRIPYEHGDFKVTKIQGRTIHPDGTVIPLETKPEDLVDLKTKGFQENTMVFTLPSVEVGSILEYRLEIRYKMDIVDPPIWEIQQPYFVHKAHYFFDPEWGAGTITDHRGESLDRLMYAHSAGVTVVLDKHGHYSVDVTDIPPLPDEDWMPPINAIRQRVEFYYTYAKSEQDSWDREGKRWGQQAEKFIKVTPELNSAAAGMISPGQTDEQKARKIYAELMKFDDTDFSREKSKAERKEDKLRDVRSAGDVWEQKGGTGNEIALLYVALARAASLKAWPMQVVVRSRALFDPTYLRIEQLDDYIAIVTIAGKETFLDPGQDVCHFGRLHWKHTQASGLRLSDNGVSIAQTPATNYTENATIRAASLSIGEQGTATGTVRITLNDADSVRWRQFALENDAEELNKKFIQSVDNDLPDGVEAELDRFLNLGDYESNLIAVFKVKGALGVPTGKYLMLPGLFFETRAKHLFVAQNRRITSIDVHYPQSEKDVATYYLPDDYVVEGSPNLTDAKWPGYATMRISSGTVDKAFQVERVLAWNYTLLNAEYYPDLRDFYLKVASADQQQIVLAHPSPQKGN